MPTDFPSQNLHSSRIYPALRQTTSLWIKWWTEQLIELVPVWIRQAYSSQSHRAYILCEEDDYVAAAEPIGRIRQTSAHPLETLASERPVLLIGRAGVLVRERDLPVASMAQYQEVMRLQVPAETPFDLSEVFVDSQITDIDLEHGHITVRQVLLRQDIALRHQRALRDRQIQIAGIDVLDETNTPMGLNLLPAPLRANPSQFSRRTNFFLLLIIAVLVILSGWSQSARAGRDIRTLERQMAYVETQAHSVLDLQQSLNRRADLFRTLDHLGNDPAQLVPLYLALTDALPEDTYLEALSFKDGRLSLIGLSASTETLVERLEGIDGVESARLLSSTAASGNAAQERFRMDLLLSTVSIRAPEANG